jgi:hypothetical protein
MVGQGSSRTMSTQRQLIATRTTSTEVTTMTRVTVKNNNISDQRRRKGGVLDRCQQVLEMVTK